LPLGQMSVNLLGDRVRQTYCAGPANWFGRYGCRSGFRCTAPTGPGICWHWPTVELPPPVPPSATYKLPSGPKANWPSGSWTPAL